MWLWFNFPMSRVTVVGSWRRAIAPGRSGLASARPGCRCLAFTIGHFGLVVPFKKGKAMWYSQQENSTTVCFVNYLLQMCVKYSELGLVIGCTMLQPICCGRDIFIHKQQSVWISPSTIPGKIMRNGDVIIDNDWLSEQKNNNNRKCPGIGKNDHELHSSVQSIN